MFHSVKKWFYRRPKSLFRLLVAMGIYRIFPTNRKEADLLVAVGYLDLRGKTCVIIGCNQGEECRFLVEKCGAAAVHGVDIMDNIGIAYNSPRVRYIQTSAESMPEITGDTYDFVLCYATMEHIPRIERAFAEMVRIAKPGGIIYSLASPLWNSRFGHHRRSLFPDYPWIHLRLAEKQIIEYCTRHQISGPGGSSISEHVAYMLDSAHFNKTAAENYVTVCDKLMGIRIICNELSPDDPALLTRDIFDELRPKGFTRKELLSATHLFVARKR